MKKVYSAADPMQAHLVLGLLEANGIAGTVMGEALGLAQGALPFGSDSSPSVWIANDENEPRALALIRDHDGQCDPKLCANCGYNLFGLPDPRCPECGQPFRRTKKAESWTCPGCGEQIAGQFTDCWKCGRSRSDERP